MSVKWSQTAKTDIDGIASYLLDNEGRELASSTTQKIIDAAKILGAFPLSGKAGRIPGTREIVVRKLPYVLVYAAQQGAVQIVRVFHTSRLFPDSLTKD